MLRRLKCGKSSLEPDSYSSSAIRRVIRLMDETTIYASDDAIDAFQFLARRRHRLSHGRVRSTTQRRGRMTNPAKSDRLMISIVILGIWFEETEGAKFWLRVMNELKNRGVAEILIAMVIGMKGFPEAINAAFPETIVQTCIVHLLRNSMSFVSWKDRKPIAQALRSVYYAETAEAGLAALDAFEEGHWGKRHPAIAQSWRRHWNQVIPFFAFLEGVRRIIYPINAIEALNSKLRRAVRTRGHFPGDDAAMKLLYLVLNTAAHEWKRPPREWSEAKPNSP